jgi:hypothetical protein
LRSTGFKEGVYVEIPYQAIEQAISDVRPVMEWLVVEIPNCDGVSVRLGEEAFDLLEGRANPPE